MNPALKILPLSALAFACVLTSCSPPAFKLDTPAPPNSKTIIDLERMESTAIGLPLDDEPWVAHVRAIDLDQDGRTDVIGCEAKDDIVVWLKQLPNGDFEEITLADDMQAPVHVEAYDLDDDGDLDLLVSCMNVVFPNNDKIGALIVLENDGQQNFTKRVLLENVERVTDAKAHDMDGDGKLDLIVGHFGYDQGHVRWMRNTGHWQYESETLLNLSGVIHVCIDDYNGDQTPDIAAIFSQQWEEIHLFENDGNGTFEGKTLWGSTNPEFACSGMTSGDIDGDGLPDLIFANGDGFDPTTKPGPRPWHGVQYLKNTGGGDFEYKRIGSLGGAYGPEIADFDNDGDQDIIAVSTYNDWSDPKAESLVYFENVSNTGEFTKVVLALSPIQLLTVDVHDFNNDGQQDLITGGFNAYPPFERMSRFTLWQNTSSQN